MRQTGEETQNTQTKDGRTNFTLRVKEQGLHLTLRSSWWWWRWWYFCC